MAPAPAVPILKERPSSSPLDRPRSFFLLESVYGALSRVGHSFVPRMRFMLACFFFGNMVSMRQRYHLDNMGFSFFFSGPASVCFESQPAIICISPGLDLRSEGYFFPLLLRYLRFFLEFSGKGLPLGQNPLPTKYRGIFFRCPVFLVNHVFTRFFPADVLLPQTFFPLPPRLCLEAGSRFRLFFSFRH